MKRKRILIVEDERTTAKVLEIGLKALGYEIVGPVSSGEDAIAQAEQNRPDLVLMDIVLDGEMDGVEAAGIIQTRFNIPFIYVTAYSERETIDRAPNTVPAGHVLKPILQKELVASIEKALAAGEGEQRMGERDVQD